MYKATMKKTLIGATLAAMSMTANAQTNMFDGEWHFTVTPYAFMPHINQSVTLDRRMASKSMRRSALARVTGGAR